MAPNLDSLRTNVMPSTRVDAILSRWRFTLFLCVLVAAGCAPVPGAKPRTAAGSAGVVPLPSLPVPGSDHYRVDPERSDVRILVYRGGPLASVGHNHVLRVHGLQGDVYVAGPVSRSGFSLSFPVAALEVDAPAARAEAGSEFATVLSPQAIAATYRNMTGPAVLDAARHPDIALQSVAVTEAADSLQVTVRITLLGTSRDLVVPARMDAGAGDITITTEFTLRTTDFGMTPFSVLGGGLRVEDEVRIRARIVAALTG